MDQLIGKLFQKMSRFLSIWKIRLKFDLSRFTIHTGDFHRCYEAYSHHDPIAARSQICELNYLSSLSASQMNGGLPPHIGHLSIMSLLVLRCTQTMFSSRLNRHSRAGFNKGNLSTIFFSFMASHVLRFHATWMDSGCTLFVQTSCLCLPVRAS